MISYRKTLVACLLVVSLQVNPLNASAETTKKISDKSQTNPITMTLDLIFLRPLGLVAILGGAVVFVVSSPFSALGDNIDEAWNSLVVAPAEYTFKRPLGDYD